MKSHSVYTCFGLLIHSLLMIGIAHSAESVRDPSDPQLPILTDITTAEYFIDTDPGPGNGILLSIFEDEFGHWSYFHALYFLGLPMGEHVFYVRYKDGLNRWSGAKGRRFYVGAQKELVSAEEFIDTDPGQGMGQLKFVPDSIESYTWDNHSHNESYGQHILYSRYQTEDGFWGHAFPVRLNIAPGQTFTDAEYFLGPDTGQGNGSALDYPDAANSISNFQTTNLQATAIGKQPFRLRHRMSGGYWSPPAERRVNVIPEAATDSIHIGGAELFIDTDPGEGNGLAMSPVDGAFNDLEEQATANASLNGLSFGLHTVCVRLRDASNRWTNSVCAMIGTGVRAVIQPLPTGNPLLTDVRISWDYDSLATEYRVYSDTLADGSFTDFATVTDTTVTYAADLAKKFYYILPYAPGGLLYGRPNAKLTRQSNN